MADDDGPAIEAPDMPEAERRALLARLADRLLDPGGLDWETLQNIEELTAPEEPTDEERRQALEWWQWVRRAPSDANKR